jgi:hypothetical protein
MWNSSTSMSGSPFCRQAATMAPSFIGGQVFAVLDTGNGGFRENVGVGIARTRLVVGFPRKPRAPPARGATQRIVAVRQWTHCRLHGPLRAFCGHFSHCPC